MKRKIQNKQKVNNINITKTTRKIACVATNFSYLIISCSFHYGAILNLYLIFDKVLYDYLMKFTFLQ